MEKFNWKLWKFVLIFHPSKPPFHQNHSTHIGVKKSISMISNQASFKLSFGVMEFHLCLLFPPEWKKHQKFHHISFVFWTVMQRIFCIPFLLESEKNSPHSEKRRVGCENWDEIFAVLAQIGPCDAASLSEKEKFSRMSIKLLEEKSSKFPSRLVVGHYKEKSSLAEKFSQREDFPSKHQHPASVHNVNRLNVNGLLSLTWALNRRGWKLVNSCDVFCVCLKRNKK